MLMRSEFIWALLGVLLLGARASSSSGDATYLKKIFYECNRRCDTHFSSPDCWEKTFNFFINHLLQSLVDYGNAQSAAKWPNTDDLLFGTYQEFIKDPDSGDFISNVVNEFHLIFNRTLTKLPRLTDSTTTTNSFVKCPTACQKDSLVVWISLFGVFIGLTLAAIVCVTIYISYVKAKHRRFEKLSKT